VPKTNTEFWTAKVARNQARDQEVWRKLEAKGWAVIIVWECELEKARLAETIDRVSSEIIHNGELLLESQSRSTSFTHGVSSYTSCFAIRESAHLAELKD
jgi:DNA G:T-mismatch repair endonuclease